MVGTTGLEPATSSVSRKRSNQLSYAPANQHEVVYQDRGDGERRRLPLAGLMLYHRSRANELPSPAMRGAAFKWRHGLSSF
jgi:hypothetical protein